MNEKQHRERNIAGRQVLLKSAQITTSHSFSEKDREDVFAALDNSLNSECSRKNDRRLISELDTDMGKFHVEVHAESTNSAHLSEDEFPKERDDSVDILRIKVSCNLSPNIETPETGILECRDVLENIEDSIPWIKNSGTLSATFEITSDSDKFQYQNETVQNVHVVVFDGKIRIQDVPRSNLERSLSTLSNYTT